jgi:GxxExxY protein
MEIDDVTGIIVDAAVKIHRDLGSSHFESVYEMALASALTRRGLRVARQQPIGFVYEGSSSSTAIAPTSSSRGACCSS